ncbi:MAG: 50S ribosomal protein L24 [Fimbriimonadia bacterium]|jgi:large subunit ribosomal protein L24
MEKKTSGAKAPKLKIKSGDEVEVIAGKDKGQRGKVVEVLRDRMRVRIEGLNLATKHVKPQRSAAGTRPGDRISRAMPIHISNVKLVDPHSGKATRVGRKEVNGKLVRYAKVSGELIDAD